MANPATFPGDVVCPGNLRLTGSVTPLKNKSAVLANEEKEKVIPFSDLRVWDNNDAVLPETPATDDLGLVGGTFATNSRSVQTVDYGGTSTTAYARVDVEIPQDYVAGQSFKLRFHGGMHTTVSDNTCTLDVAAYRSDEERGISADLAAAAVANNIKSLTYADVDFTITATTLNPGDTLDVRIEITGADTGDSGADIRGVIGSIKMVYDGR